MKGKKQPFCCVCFSCFSSGFVSLIYTFSTFIFSSSLTQLLSISIFLFISSFFSSPILLTLHLYQCSQHIPASLISLNAFPFIQVPTLFLPSQSPIYSITFSFSYCHKKLISLFYLFYLFLSVSFFSCHLLFPQLHFHNFLIILFSPIFFSSLTAPVFQFSSIPFSPLLSSSLIPLLTRTFSPSSVSSTFILFIIFLLFYHVQCTLNDCTSSPLPFYHHTSLHLTYTFVSILIFLLLSHTLLLFSPLTAHLISFLLQFFTHFTSFHSLSLYIFFSFLYRVHRG